jgi:hypothetical protein
MSRKKRQGMERMPHTYTRSKRWPATLLACTGMAAALLLLLSIVKCTEIGCPAAAAGMVQGVVPARRRDQDELERWCGRMKGELEFCIL